MQEQTGVDPITGDKLYVSVESKYVDTVWLAANYDPDVDGETYWWKPYRSAYAKLDTMTMVSDEQWEYVNVYPLYAYNKCFYDYMRNSYFDLDYSVYNYNCDFVSGSSFEDSIIHSNMLPCRFYW